MLKLMFGMFQNFSITSPDTSNIPRKLQSCDIETVVNYLKTCKNVICMVGAGISTSAGIPDFRSPGSGLYSKLDVYKLPTPESVFDLDYFKKNPQAFFTLSKELFPSNFKPTLSHYFMLLLHQKGVLRRVYSQNIDMLEELAGIPEDKVLNAHGTFKQGHCITCNEEYSFNWMKNEIFKKEFLKCNKCENGLIKPDIVFFGEPLPKAFFSNLEDDFESCDLLIIMGTSLKVHPFASLTNLVSIECPRLLINRDLVESNFLFTQPEINYRDVFLQSDCDEACLKIAKLLKWDTELKAIMTPPPPPSTPRTPKQTRRSSNPPPPSVVKKPILKKK